MASVFDGFFEALERGVGVAGQAVDKYSGFLEAKAAYKARTRQGTSNEQQSLPSAAHPSLLAGDTQTLVVNALSVTAVAVAAMMAWKFIK